MVYIGTGEDLADFLLLLLLHLLAAAVPYFYTTCKRTVKIVRSIVLKKVDPGNGSGLEDHGYFCESTLEIGKGRYRQLTKVSIVAAWY